MRVRGFAIETCRAATLLLCLLSVPSLGFGEVTKVNVAGRVTVANGQAFGKTGPYEKLTGTIEFAVDPKERTTLGLPDIDRALPGPDKPRSFHVRPDGAEAGRSSQRQWRPAVRGGEPGQTFFSSTSSTAPPRRGTRPHRRSLATAI
jgi:hypothetical protein